jgi:hypothetical protein
VHPGVRVVCQHVHETPKRYVTILADDIPLSNCVPKRP